MSAYATKGKGLTRTDSAGVRAVAQGVDYAPCADVINVINVLQSIKGEGFQPELEDRCRFG